MRNSWPEYCKSIVVNGMIVNGKWSHTKLLWCQCSYISDLNLLSEQIVYWHRKVHNESCCYILGVLLVWTVLTLTFTLQLNSENFKWSTQSLHCEARFAFEILKKLFFFSALSLLFDVSNSSIYSKQNVL